MESETITSDEEPQVIPEMPPLGHPVTMSRSNGPLRQSPEASTEASESMETSDSSSNSSTARDTSAPAIEKRLAEQDLVDDVLGPRRSQRPKPNLEAHKKGTELRSSHRLKRGRVILHTSKTWTPTPDLQTEAQNAAAELRKENDRLKFRIREMETQASSEMIEVSEQLLATCGKIEQLESALSASREENQRLQQSNDKLRTTVAKVEDEKYRYNNPGPKVSDDVIQQKWRLLGCEIQNFVMQLVNQNPHGNIRPQNVADPWAKEVTRLRARWGKLAPNGMSHFLVQKYIWTRIHSDIFNGGAAAWGVQIGSLFQSFSHHFGVADFDIKQEFSVYKSRLGHTLARARDVDGEKTIGRLIKELRKELFVFTKPDGGKEFVQRMRGILKQAVDLQVIFMTSRAFFISKEADPNSSVDYNEMDVRFVHGNGLDGAMKLDIVISPMIEKVGNADGHMFDARSIVCKALVTTKQVQERTRNSAHR